MLGCHQLTYFATMVTSQLKGFSKLAKCFVIKRFVNNFSVPNRDYPVRIL